MFGKVLKNRYFILVTSSILYVRHYIQTRRLLKHLPQTKEDVKRYQFQKIRELLIYANQYCPYYTELFRNINFTPATDFNSIEDIRKIPLLTKDIIKKNSEKIISTKEPSKFKKLVRSGGTTSIPLEFYLDKRTSSPVELAYLQYAWKNVGFHIGDPCIVMRSDLIEPKGEKYWRFNLFTNWLSMSTFHLNKATFPFYYKKMLKFKPKFIIGYPSIIYQLAKLIDNAGLPPLASLEAVICSSENVYDWQKQYIEKILQVKVTSYYGSSEKCSFAMMTGDKGMYEFLPSYGFIEVIDKEGNWCEQEDAIGDIIVTGFNNLLFPFIRYRCEDRAVITHNNAFPGREWQTIKRIEGRCQDFVVDNKGNFNTFIFGEDPMIAYFDKINAFQYVQEVPGKIHLSIEAQIPLENSELDTIKKKFHFYAPDIELSIDLMDSIPRTERGKFKYLIQKIDLSTIKQ